MSRSEPFVFAVFALIFGGFIAAGAAVTLALSDAPWYVAFYPVPAYAAYGFVVHAAFRAFKPYFEEVPG